MFPPPGLTTSLLTHVCRRLPFAVRWNRKGTVASRRTDWQRPRTASPGGTMASRLGSSLERLCILGYNFQFRRKSSFAKLHTIHPRPLSRNLINQCQESRRKAGTMQNQQPGPLAQQTQPIIDPYHLIVDDIRDCYDNIRQELITNTDVPELSELATYYFELQGKALRPMVVLLISYAINYHTTNKIELTDKQRKLAMISELVHNASLVHDDVIDMSDMRRGRPSVIELWNHKKVGMAGDYILACASLLIARLRNDDVTLLMSQIITDLVQGEFMQLGSKETENERFAHYLNKTYRKTASLIANSLKSAALLGCADESLCEVAFQYGRNLGLAFQLVDDLLDFVSSTEALGKPAAADLKLGLATAPVLFACEKYPELNAMIMRRFQEPGDAERAFELVHKSRGLEQTQFLAKKHCTEAARLASTLEESAYQKALIVLTEFVLNRMK